MHSYACWDDDYDDYYGYDDDDDDDYDDDWLYDYGDDCINGGTIDEVVITPDYDWGLNDDWWRRDNGEDDDEEDDDEEDDDGNDEGYDDNNIGSIHNDNNNTTTVIVPPLLPYEVHKPESNEKLFKENLPVRYPGQTCDMNCFTTTLAICNALMTGDFSFNDYLASLNAIENWFKLTFNRDICHNGIEPDELNKFLTDGCGLIYNYVNESNITSCIDNGDLVMVTIGDGSHEVVIVGYYNDVGGIDAYQCVNPANGRYETHYGYEFDKDTIIKYSKNNH